MIEIAIAIAVVNIIVALIFVGWCNKKIKNYTNKDNWK
jgi:integral membrane sensor domain MASE1